MPFFLVPSLAKVLDRKSIGREKYWCKKYWTVGKLSNGTRSNAFDWPDVFRLKCQYTANFSVFQWKFGWIVTGWSGS